MMVVLIILTAFVGFFLFLVKGRTGQKTLSVLRQHYYAHRGLHGQGVAWTLRTKMDFDTAVQEGWIPVFENFKP